MNQLEKRILSNNQIRSTQGSRVVQGTAIVFNTRTWVSDLFWEIILPEAIDESLLKTDIRALINHDKNLIMGRVKSGTLALTKTYKGVNFQFDTPNTTAGNNLLEAINRGDITQASFTFHVEKEEWSKTFDGHMLRTILKIDRITDVSPVTYAAYPTTSVGLRTYSSINLASLSARNRQLQLLKLNLK
jgi:HK97 family phage prohead protease